MTFHAHDDQALALEQSQSTVKKADDKMMVTDEASNGESLDVELDPKMEKKLLVKLDLFFVPIIMLTYLSCFLDRSNIGMYPILAQCCFIHSDKFFQEMSRLLVCQQIFTRQMVNSRQPCQYSMRHM